jgi:dTDP-4-amino-4,6-dideoxygalactose transaminase
MIKIAKIINLLSYIRGLLSINNIISSTKIFYYSILKQNTRYPNYLLDFEKNISKYFGSKYALTFSNGTTACTALLYSLGVKKGSRVLVSKLTFPSVVSTILRIGAKPVYLDFDKDLQIDNNDNHKVQSSEFILITHAYGIPQNFKIIESILSLNKNLILIEDVSHAQGAISNNKLVGTLGDGSFMSMQGDKAINAGEGGIVLTNKDNIYNRLIYLSHLNRKTSNQDNVNLLSKIGFIGKSRMSPLGAITALNDVKNLRKKNEVIREKIKVIYKGLESLNNIHTPKIDNYENTGGFHYGIPFFCNSKSLLENLKNEFKIIKYNWPILDADENFHDPNKFLNLIYDEDPNIDKVFKNSNDIRDELYFFELKDLIKLSETKIKKKLNIIIKNEN